MANIAFKAIGPGGVQVATLNVAQEAQFRPFIENKNGTLLLRGSLTGNSTNEFSKTITF